MKYYIVYKTTNVISNRFYIGVHRTNNLNDGYLGSGKSLKTAILKYGKENFYREILKFCDDYEQALAYEAELITQEMLDERKCYNMIAGGGMPPTHIGSDNHNFGKRLEWASIRMSSDLNPSLGKFGEDSHSFNCVSVVDESGKTMQVKKDDPRYVSGELNHVNKGKLTVKNADGNVFHVPRNDPRFLSGELKHVTKGLILTCPHCNKTGGNSMKRWHFDNCRDKTNDDSGDIRHTSRGA